jgi:hypothetical protein
LGGAEALQQAELTKISQLIKIQKVNHTNDLLLIPFPLALSRTGDFMTSQVSAGGFTLAKPLANRIRLLRLVGTAPGKAASSMLRSLPQCSLTQKAVAVVITAPALNRLPTSKIALGDWLKPLPSLRIETQAQVKFLPSMGIHGVESLRFLP